MMPVVPCSASNVSYIPGTSFTTRKNGSLSSQRFFIAFPRTNTLFPQSKIGRFSVEVQDISVSDEEFTREVETNGKIAAPTMEKKRRGRKTEMPPVKDEDLLPGTIFTGKVRSIQPFGAFVDFGAFTDGLVHLSRLSENFVKDVNDVVSLGQEVKVRLVEANTETGRISLSMRENDGSNDLGAKTDKPGSPRKSDLKETGKKKEFKKTSKFTKGQELVGTVKNFGRSGAFIALPEGEEGFLPTSEESDDGFGNVMGQTSLEVGQEVKVRVLRIARGIMTLSMKKEEDVEKLESKLNQGIVHTAKNPFVVAFRRNKDIAAFLDDREKIEEQPEIEVEETMKQANTNDTEKTIKEEDGLIFAVGDDINETSLVSREFPEETETESSDRKDEGVNKFSPVEAQEQTSIRESSEGTNESSS